jgi:hypothetical protein
LRIGGQHLTWIHMLLLPWLQTQPSSGNHKPPLLLPQKHTCIELFGSHCLFLIRIWSLVFLGVWLCVVVIVHALFEGLLCYFFLLFYLSVTIIM